MEASEAKGERDLILARAFTHPRDKRIRFVESSHKYYLDGEMLPISVTGFYGRYFGHFDADDVVEKNIDKWRKNPRDKRHSFLKALENMGATQKVMEDAIKFAWVLNGDHQSSLGTALHRAIELTMNGQPIPDVPPPMDIEIDIDANTDLGVAMLKLRNAFSLCNRDILRVLVSAGVHEVEGVIEVIPPPPRADVVEYGYFEKWRTNNTHLIPVRAEWSIFADDMLLAGQIDMVMYDTKRKVMCIVDWKRSKSMEYEAFGDRRGKPPFGDLPDTNIGCVHFIICFLIRFLNRHRRPTGIITPSRQSTLSF